MCENIDKKELVKLLDEVENFMESMSSEADLGDHELDCDGESCILCDVRKTRDKLKGEL